MADAMASGGAADLFQDSRTPLERLQHAMHRYPVLSPAIVLVVSFLVFTYFGDGRFHQPTSIGIMLQQTAVVATLAVGQTLIILTAGIDLSVGTAMLLLSVLSAKIMTEGLPFLHWMMPEYGLLPGLFALLIAAAVGMAMGAFHGTLVTRVALPPFIVTLGTFYIYNSTGNVYSKGQTISADAIGRDSMLLWPSNSFSIGDMRITYTVLIALALYAIFAYVLANTAWGRHVYATGDDAEAARLAGINTTRVLLSVYITAGVVYAVGAWVQLGRALSAENNAAPDINLETITAVVIGGTSLFGGRGRIWGTLLGALIVTVFDFGLSLAGVDQFYKNLAIGCLILFAVALDQWIRRVGT